MVPNYKDDLRAVNLNITDLAHRFGYSYSHFYKILRGDCLFPTGLKVELLTLIARSLQQGKDGQE